MKKMTAAALGKKIRAGVRKHDLRLGHSGYIGGGTVCAIGGALAFHATNRDELWKMIFGDYSSERRGHVMARVSAKILNHNLAPRDMVMLEMGYEDLRESRYLGSKSATIGELMQVDWIRANPFYRLGQRLREESFRSTKTA